MHFCEWLEHTALITAITNSLVISTIVEVLHYFSLFLLVGPILIVDLRLMGLAARRRNAAELAGDLFALMWAGMALNFLTGFLLFAGDATTFYGNHVFHFKLAVILVAVIFSIIVQWNAGRWGRLPAVPVQGKFLAFVSLALWIGSILAAVEVPSLTSVG